MEKILFTDHWQYALQGEEKRPVILPHDAMQMQKRSADAASGGGGAFFPGGIYTYEKQWNVPSSYAQKQIVLYFEGVYRNTTVKINGQIAGGRKYGYIPFEVDISDIIKPGETNIIEVIADNSDTPNSRWYSGGGIYRPVWLYVGEKRNIRPHGLKIHTVSVDPAVIHVSVESNASLQPDVTVVAEIIFDGKTVACTQGFEEDIEVKEAKLWDEETPNLYTCRAKLMAGGTVIDQAETCFGIRTVEVSEKGFYINGKETLLRGGCIHSDNGILGSASFPEAEYRKAKLLKEAGFNALRSSHNPASPAFLDACDRLGLYVMDEGWDMWYKRKTKYDYGSDFMENYEADIKDMVDSDYNHPSVIMYSIGNEISEPAEEKGVELAGKLAEKFREKDSSRLITVGCNIAILAGSKAGNDTFDPDSGASGGTFEIKSGELDSTAFNEIISKVGAGMEMSANSREADEATAPLFEKVDIAGYNYAFGRYEMDGEIHPDRVIVGSETFPHCIWRNWLQVKKLRYLIGDFMWTALDYIGEAGLGAWSYETDGIGFAKPYPWVLAEAGALDLIGTPTGEIYMAQAAWDCLKAPAIAVSPDVCYPGVTAARGAWRGTNSIPSWSFAGCSGNLTQIEIHSADAFAELLINGKSAGKKPLENGIAVYEHEYIPGTIQAITFDSFGKETGRSELKSAEGELSLRLTKEITDESVKLGSVVFVHVEIVGENGVVESNADRFIEVYAEGGTVLGFGSARARSLEHFADGKYTTYYGRALAAVMVGDSGTARFIAKDGEKKYELVI